MTVHVVQGADGLTRRAFTAADVRRMIEVGIMDEGEPFELVEGELIFMNPQGFAHDLIKTDLARKLGRFLPDEFLVGAEVSLQLANGSVIQPDVVVARRRAVGPSSEGYLTIPAAGILLIIEVASSSLSFDRGRKAAIYGHEGVPEYWVIDANRRRAWMHRSPSPKGFCEVIAAAPDEELRPAAAELEGFAVRLAELN